MTNELDGVGWYTVDEAAQLLRVNKSWLRRAVTGRRVPCVRLGRNKVRFTAAQLREITKSFTEQPVLATPRPRAPRQ